MSQSSTQVGCHQGASSTLCRECPWCTSLPVDVVAAGAGRAGHALGGKGRAAAGEGEGQEGECRGERQESRRGHAGSLPSAGNHGGRSLTVSGTGFGGLFD